MSFALFELKKNKSGVEYCARVGKALRSKDRGISRLKKLHAGVLLDTGDFNPAGLSHIDTLMLYGAEPVAVRRMPLIAAALNVEEV